MSNNLTSKQFEIVCHLVENHLNNIKYLYTSQIFALIEICKQNFELDFNKKEDLTLAVDSVKKAIEIYFIHEEDDIENALSEEKLKWWIGLTSEKFKITIWNNKTILGWKGDDEIPRNILFHISRRLTFQDEI